MHWPPQPLVHKPISRNRLASQAGVKGVAVPLRRESQCSQASAADLAELEDRSRAQYSELAKLFGEGLRPTGFAGGTALENELHREHRDRRTSLLKIPSFTGSTSSRKRTSQIKIHREDILEEEALAFQSTKIEDPSASRFLRFLLSIFSFKIKDSPPSNFHSIYYYYYYSLLLPIFDPGLPHPPPEN